jgi:hypothetical protein
MKSYFILDCDKQQSIADSLYGYYTGISVNRELKEFWNHLTRDEIQNYFSIPNLELKKWFDGQGLKVRDMSFTVYNEVTKPTIRIHKDAPPVIAKINFPVLNTADTYNVWYDDQGNEIDRVECTKPIVLRSDINHTVEIGPDPKYPRLQFSFCFYNEPLHLLK